jgi:4-diphosphocytidyl-2-C-methyl-D-erythritol kinase
MSTWTTRAYAKINLGLHVLRRRPDGYHDIETGFVFVNWYDELMVKHASEDALTCDDEKLSTGPDNLVLKALELFRRKGYFDGNVAFDLKKRVPYGAGLGGGSSDAAAALRLLNTVAGHPLDGEALQQLGAELGSDVPVFLANTPCIGTGRGTELESVAIQPDAWIVTAFPGFGSATPEAYKRCYPNDEREPLRSILLDSDSDDWQTFLENDLEAPVISMYPQIGDFKDEFYQLGAFYSAMSGSGSAVFGLFHQEFVAQDAFLSFKQLGYKANLTEPGFKPDTRVYRLDM